jgi:branched-chain amino acid transport system ATP-binding protein
VLIEVTDLVAGYGPATVLDGVGLTVAAGEAVALIGPNGAGKTTLVDVLTGGLRPISGTVRVQGRLGVVPEGRRLFGTLSVEDNLRLGAWRIRKRRSNRDPARVVRLLPGLEPLLRARADRLSGGQQQLVAIGRALMADPEVLVIDELSLGLAPKVVADLAQVLRTLHEAQGMAVLLIEQHARLALELCERGYVLEAGRIRTEGPSRELAADEGITQAYLGPARQRTTQSESGAETAVAQAGPASAVKSAPASAPLPAPASAPLPASAVAAAPTPTPEAGE